MVRTLLVFLIALACVFAQRQDNGTVANSGATIDFSAAGTTKSMKSGTSLPGTCAVGQFFNKTDATAARVIYACTATNTWTQQGGSGGEIGTANQVSGTNAAGNAVEQKSIVAGTNITVTHGVGSITIGGPAGGSGTNLNVTSVLDHGADATGAANSSTAFTNALAAVSTNGTVIVPCGTYRLNTGITVTSKHLVGAGQRCATLLKYDDVNAVVTVAGTDGSVENFIIDGRKAFVAASRNIQLTGTRPALINVHVKDPNYHGVQLDNSTGGVIRDCDITDAGNSAVWGENDAINTLVQNNRMRGAAVHPVGFHGTFADKSVSGTRVIGNVMDVANPAAFCVEIGDFGGIRPQNVQVLSNTCVTTGASFGGYSLAQIDGGSVVGNTFDGGGTANNYCFEFVGVSGFAITGNVCRGMSDTEMGIQIDWSFSNSVVTGNTVEGFRPTGATSGGIMASTSSAAKNILNNVIANNTVVFPASGVGRGITLNHNAASGSNSYNIIANNTVLGTSHASSYGIAILNDGGAATITSNQITGNVVRATGTAIVLGNNTNSSMVNGNILQGNAANFLDNSTTKGPIIEPSAASISISGIKTAVGTAGLRFVCTDTNGILYSKTTACGP